jgi:hypothetical protein
VGGWDAPMGVGKVGECIWLQSERKTEQSRWNSTWRFDARKFECKNEVSKRRKGLTAKSHKEMLISKRVLRIVKDAVDGWKKTV